MIVLHTWFEWTIQQAEFFWLQQHSGRGKHAVRWIRRPPDLHLKHYRAVLKQQRCGSKYLVPNSHVGLIECKKGMYHLFPRRLLALFPLSWFLGIRRSARIMLLKPENVITAASCTSFSYLNFCGIGYLVIPLYDLLQQVVQVLFTWNTGFLSGTWSYSGASRWCYYKLKYQSI